MALKALCTISQGMFAREMTVSKLKEFLIVSAKSLGIITTIVTKRETSL